MNIIRSTHRINAPQIPIPNTNYLSGRIGFWGVVSAQNSLNNTVTVVSDTGYELKNIPVFSSEWVTVDDNKNYIPSTRNLPPVKSRVFVLTPTFSATGAFVLCSGFSKGDENIRTLWAQNENELEDKNNCRETKTQGGWDIKEEYANGNFSAISNDEKITITVNTTQDDNKSQVKEVSLEAWGRKITINKNGIKLVDIQDEDNNKKNEINFTNNGLSIVDVNNNQIETSDSGITATDAHNKTIQLSHSSTKDNILVKDGDTEIVNYNHATGSLATITFLGHLEVSQ